MKALVTLLASEAGLKSPKFDPTEILSNIPPIATKIDPENEMTSPLIITSQGENAGPVADVIIGYDKQSITSEMHRYSLSLSVTWHGPRDQDFFNVCLLWPKDISITKLTGFERDEASEIDSLKYDELSLFVDKRLWPKKTIKAIGGNAAAQLEYVFNSETHIKVHNSLRQKAYKIYYKLYSQEFQPVEGEVSFKELEEKIYQITNKRESFMNGEPDRFPHIFIKVTGVRVPTKDGGLMPKGHEFRVPIGNRDFIDEVALKGNIPKASYGEESFIFDPITEKSLSIDQCSNINGYFGGNYRNLEIKGLAPD